MNNFNEEKLPEGWEVKSLADIGNIFSGNSINTKLKEEKYTNKEGTPYVATKDISYNSVINYDNGINIPLDDVNKFRLAKSETILICAEGGSAGRKVGILNQDVYFVNKLFALETISEVNSKFCFYWYLSKEFKSNFKDKLKGLIGGVSKTDYKNLPIPIPPLKEQKRIIARIDTLFAKIDKAISLTEESLKQAENLLPSLLAEIFSRLSVKNKLVELSELCDFKNGFAFKSKEFNKVGDGIQVLRIGNVLDVDKNPVFIEEKDAYRDYMLNKNDIVISMTGTRLKKDYLFVRVIKNEPFYLNQRVGKISSKPTNYYMYIYFYLKSNMFRSEVFKYETGAVNQGNISGKTIMKMVIPKVDIDAQKEIANKCLDVSNQSKQTQSKLEEQLGYLKQLKSSILSKAFKGEL